MAGSDEEQARRPAPTSRPATAAFDLSGGDHADAVTDGGPDLPQDAEPDLKDVAAAARRADADSAA